MTRAQNIAAQEVCERATKGPWQTGYEIDCSQIKRDEDIIFIALTRDPKVGYEAILREHLRLMDALDVLRKEYGLMTWDDWDALSATEKILKLVESINSQWQGRLNSERKL